MHYDAALPMAPSFLTGQELSGEQLTSLLDRAAALKAGRPELGSDSLAGKSVALIFEMPSTRTRISFEVGVAELGGTPVVLRSDEMQLKRGEPIRDTAQVLSRFVHAIAIRSDSHANVSELAEWADVPVINALTELHHPCQAIADLQTLNERFGRLEGLKVAFVGDGNNVARSLAIAGAKVGVEVVVSSPEGFTLDDTPEATLVADPREAVAGADAIYTDVWVSLSEDEETAGPKREALAPYGVDDALLDAAAPGAIFLHCLPAHPGEEVTADVLYGGRSAVWDQAENRLHAQKALLELLLGS